MNTPPPPAHVPGHKLRSSSSGQAGSSVGFWGGMVNLLGSGTKVAGGWKGPALHKGPHLQGLYMVRRAQVASNVNWSGM